LDIRSALQEIPRFADVLRPDQLDALAAQSAARSFPAGAVLMAQGDFGASMFAIVDGRVSVRFSDPPHPETEITQLKRGNIVGEMALLTGDPRTATVSALTEVEAIEITKPALERAFEKSPDLVESFASVLTIRRMMLEQIAAEHQGQIAEQFVRQIRRVFSGILPSR
jgi:CRP-like cAMP-binding protein